VRKRGGGKREGGKERERQRTRERATNSNTAVVPVSHKVGLRKRRKGWVGGVSECLSYSRKLFGRC